MRAILSAYEGNTILIRCRMGARDPEKDRVFSVQDVFYGGMVITDHLRLSEKNGEKTYAGKGDILFMSVKIGAYTKKDGTSDFGVCKFKILKLHQFNNHGYFNLNQRGKKSQSKSGRKNMR